MGSPKRKRSTNNHPCSPASSSVLDLHIRIVRPATTLGHDPVDVLGRILDVAGLAVDAVLRVNLKPGVGAGVVADDLVDASWAVALLGRVVFRKVDPDRDRGILQGQVRWLAGQSHMEFTVVEGWLHLLGEWRYQLGSRVPERRGTRVSAFLCS